MMDYQDRIKEEDQTPIEAGQVERELWELLGELGTSTPGEDGTCPLREGDWLCGAEVQTSADAAQEVMRARGWEPLPGAVFKRGVVVRLRNGATFELEIRQVE